MKKFITIFLLFFFGFVAFAQKTHIVAKGDNPYNIAKKYGMTLEELTKLNPKLKEGKLAIGDVITINKKVVEKPKTTEKPVVNSAKTGTIVLQPKQTIYGITKQYHIAEADLRKLNPDLDNHLKIGDEVTLPAENIKKYADKNAFNRSAVVVEKPTETVAETPKTEEGKYVIQPKDTYYGLTKKFNVTQEELFKLNPGLEEKGLQPGDILNVNKIYDSKVKETVTWQEEKTEPKAKTPVAVTEETPTYTVKEGDTVFGILNKFNISLNELLELNPKLTEGLKPGMVLKLKKAEEKVNNVSSYTKKTGDALNVVLMLPFGFDEGESKYRNMAADFLTGAKLAIERNAESGQKLDVKIIDSGSEASFKKSLSQINQNNTDLIVGPFFKSNVLDVLDYVKSQKVPVVAPFASSPELKNYSNLVIIETDESVFADRIVKEVSTVYSDQKIYVVTDEDKTYANYIKTNLEKQYKNAQIFLVDSASEIQLDNNMMTGQTAPVIAVLASDDDVRGADFAKKVIEISAGTEGVKAFSMYYHSAFEKNVSNLGKANLVYLMDRKINNEGEFEKEILSTYKKKYCKTPSKYAVIGFDVMNDMLSRENGKGELFKQMDKTQTQLATKFEFVKSKGGAYVNQGYRVVRLLP